MSNDFFSTRSSRADLRWDYIRCRLSAIGVRYAAQQCLRGLIDVVDTLIDCWVMPYPWTISRPASGSSQTLFEGDTRGLDLTWSHLSEHVTSAMDLACRFTWSLSRSIGGLCGWRCHLTMSGKLPANKLQCQHSPSRWGPIAMTAIRNDYYCKPDIHVIIGPSCLKEHQNVSCHALTINYHIRLPVNESLRHNVRCAVAYPTSQAESLPDPKSAIRRHQTAR